MRKFILLLVAVATLTTSAAFAQDRVIGAYIDTSIENLIATKDRNSLYTDFGVSYAQNFVGVEWLTAGLEIAFSGVRTAGESGSNGYSGSWDTPDISAELSTVISGEVFGVDALEIGLAVDTDVNINLEVGFGFEAGPGELGLWLGADFNGYPGVMSEFFSDVYFGIGYGIGFNDIFGLDTSLELTYDNDLGLEFIVDFVAGLEGGFGAYLGLGFTVDEMIDGDAGLGLALRGGISYDFNF